MPGLTSAAEIVSFRATRVIRAERSVEQTTFTLISRSLSESTPHDRICPARCVADLLATPWPISPAPPFPRPCIPWKRTNFFRLPSAERRGESAWTSP